MFFHRDRSILTQVYNDLYGFFTFCWLGDFKILQKLIAATSLVSNRKMASSESPNLVSDFEQAYSEALSTLCEEEILSDRAAIEEQKIVSNAFPLGPMWFNGYDS